MQKTPRRFTVLPVIAFYLYLAGSARFLGEWDTFDYLKQIVAHRLSDLGVGRPVFLGYNILLWESAKRIFHLRPLHVELVAMSGTIVLGVLGVLLFQRLARRLLPSSAGNMAALALAVSPVYAIYSGFIMTEVPMLVALIASALLLWKPSDRHPVLTDVAGGILFGLAIGIREQAITLAAAFLWILFSRRPPISSRLRSVLLFGSAASIVAIMPAAVFFIHDPAGFAGRTKTWFHAIPMGSAQFRNNMEASLLYAFVLCPGAWLAAAGAGIYRLFGRRGPDAVKPVSPSGALAHPVWGIICCLILPIAVLWRDADVQMHPRYTLILLPASLILCVSLYRRWVASRRGAAIWAIVQVLAFGLVLSAFAPYRQIQDKKIDFAARIRESVPGKGLIIAGKYSPILDYYRAIGVRPGWQILWSGWDWNSKDVANRIDTAWADRVPVYLITDPPGWSYLEAEFLEIHAMLKDSPKELIFPHLYRIYPTR